MLHTPIKRKIPTANNYLWGSSVQDAQFRDTLGREQMVVKEKAGTFFECPVTIWREILTILALGRDTRLSLLCFDREIGFGQLRS